MNIVIIRVEFRHMQNCFLISLTFFFKTFSFICFYIEKLEIVNLDFSQKPLSKVTLVNGTIKIVSCIMDILS